MTQSIVFNGLPSAATITANDTVAYNAGYKDAVGLGGCATCVVTHTAQRRSAALSFRATVLAALLTAANANALSLVANPAALANAIQAAAAALGLTVQVPTASSLQASQPSVALLASSGSSDNHKWVIIGASLGAAVALAFLAFLLWQVKGSWNTPVVADATVPKTESTTVQQKVEDGPDDENRGLPPGYAWADGPVSQVDWSADASSGTGTPQQVGSADRYIFVNCSLLALLPCDIYGRMAGLRRRRFLRLKLSWKLRSRLMHRLGPS